MNVTDQPPVSTLTAVEALQEKNPSKLYCTVCGALEAVFKTGGVGKPRPNAKCPRCGSLERHRLFWLHLMGRVWGKLPGGKRDVLHVAPEQFLVKNLKARPDINYVSGDLMMSGSMAKLDLTSIQFWDEQFDLIVCSHVLEHIPDDASAMREMYRILRPGGFLLAMVPIKGEKTYEDSSIVDPAERIKHFGQDDHVRIYGRDIRDRLASVGFSVAFWPEGSDISPQLRQFINCGGRFVIECKKSPD